MGCPGQAPTPGPSELARQDQGRPGDRQGDPPAGGDLPGQAQSPGPWPILTLPDRAGGDGCLSCGAALEGRSYRCELCALAVKLALEEIL
jgi:hypothetical protein